MIYTTFELCRKHGACESGYRKLAKSLGGIRKYGETTPIPLTAVLESNGVDDCLWACRATPDDQQDRAILVAKTFAVDCAEQCLPEFEKLYPGDSRPRKAIEAARAYLAGSISRDELSAARSAARSAESAAWLAAVSAAVSAESEASEVWSAACSTAASAVWLVEPVAKQWQTTRLAELLNEASK